MKNKSLYFLTALFLFAFQLSAAAETETIDYGGYYKNFFMVQDPPGFSGETDLPIDEQPLDAIVQNKLRLKFSYFPAGWFSLNLAYEIIPKVQSVSDNISVTAINVAPNPLSYRLVDFDENIYPSSSGSSSNFSLGHNIDRAYFTLSPSFADIFIGRQPVAFGAARVVNPTDVFAPFTYQALDKEERVGIDAARVKIPIGDMSEIDVGAVFGKDNNDLSTSAFLRGKFYFLETDVSVIGISFFGNALVGLDVARAVGDAGWWLEAAYTFADALEDNGGSDGNYVRASTGFDYNFADGVYGFIEYHYNQAGETEPGNYLSLFAKTPYREGGLYLVGEHYVAPGLIYQITALWVLSFQALVNVTDPSSFISPSIEYSMAEDVFVSCGVFYGLGKEFSVDDMKPKSEFGLYSDIYFASMRLYF